MIQVILNAIIISLYTTGLYIATDENMILNPIKNWLDKKLSYTKTDEVLHYKIYKPLIACPYCMPSLHGLVPFILLNEISLHSIPIYFISFVCATGLNSITIRQYNG